MTSFKSWFRTCHDRGAASPTAWTRSAGSHRRLLHAARARWRPRAALWRRKPDKAPPTKIVWPGCHVWSLHASAGKCQTLSAGPGGVWGDRRGQSDNAIGLPMMHHTPSNAQTVLRRRRHRDAIDITLAQPAARQDLGIWKPMAKRVKAAVGMS